MVVSILRRPVYRLCRVLCDTDMNVLCDTDMNWLPRPGDDPALSTGDELLRVNKLSQIVYKI